MYRRNVRVEACVPRRLRRKRNSTKPSAVLSHEEVVERCKDSLATLDLSERVAMEMLTYDHVHMISAVPHIYIGTIIRLVQMSFLTCHNKTMVYWNQELLVRHNVQRRVCLAFVSVAVKQRRDTTDLFTATRQHQRIQKP